MKLILKQHITSAGAIWLLFLYLIDVWLGEDHRTNTINAHVYKRVDYVLKFYYFLYT